MPKKKPASVSVETHKHVADKRSNIPTRETAAFANENGAPPKTATAQCGTMRKRAYLNPEFGNTLTGVPIKTARTVSSMTYFTTRGGTVPSHNVSPV